MAVRVLGLILGLYSLNEINKMYHQHNVYRKKALNFGVAKLKVRITISNVLDRQVNTVSRRYVNKNIAK